MTCIGFLEHCLAHTSNSLLGIQIQALVDAIVQLRLYEVSDRSYIR